MSANKQESIIGKVKERLKEKRFGHSFKKKEKKFVCQEWDLNPRLIIIIKRFDMSGLGFEPTPPFEDQNTRYHLDSKGFSP